MREGGGPVSRAGIWFQGGQEGEWEVLLQEVELEEDAAMSTAGVLLS